MINNIFNVDLVNAKSGKKLTKFESNLQYVVNLILTRLFQFSIILFILFKVVLI